jgi:hypothetical protein
MHLDNGAVQRDRLDLDAHDLSMLQPFEHPIQHAELGPAVHAGVDRVPVAEALGQAAPLAAVLGHIQDRIEHLQIGQADVASLTRQTALDLFVLGLGDLHARTVIEK